MDESAEKQAFAKGIANFCSRTGSQEFAKPIEKFAGFAESYSMDPASFMAGMEKAVKKAGVYDDGNSTLRSILPWILIPAAFYGASKWGEIWGRHADATGNHRGPVAGPLHALVESLSGRKMTYVGPKASKILANSPDLKPLTADQHERLSRTGTTLSPDFFGK